jgi:hypothetical protein
MLNREDNALICHVGPGTPMGAMMRRYWHPVCTSAQLERDAAPLRVRLLGEDYVAFRDSHGKVGVMEELCMHRGASLALGRVEEGGLRCPTTAGSSTRPATFWRRPTTPTRSTAPA